MDTYFFQTKPSNSYFEFKQPKTMVYINGKHIYSDIYCIIISFIAMQKTIAGYNLNGKRLFSLELPLDTNFIKYKISYNSIHIWFFPINPHL